MAEQKFYPKGKIAMGNGDLVDVTNISFEISNGAKQISTLRRKQAGFTLGPGEGKVSFSSVISEGGLERDYFKDCQKGKAAQLRIKLPGGLTLTYNGVYSSVKGDMPLDDATKVDCEFIGKLVDL